MHSHSILQRLILFLALVASVADASSSATAAATTTTTTTSDTSNTFTRPRASRIVTGSHHQDILRRRRPTATGISILSPIQNQDHNAFPVEKPRGGAAPTSSSNNQVKAVGGAIYFLILDVLLRKVFKAKGIAFPSMLGGTCILFAALVLVELIRPGVGDAAFDMLNPGAGLLAKWLPVFFVPGLAMLPLAPSMGSAFEVVKVLAVVIIGFFFTLSTTAYSVLGIRTMQGVVETSSPEPAAAVQTAKKKVKAAVKEASAPAPAPAKPYSDETLDFLVKGFVISGAISIAASRADHTYATPLQTIFMGFTTLLSYVWGARLPSSITKVLHPLIVSTAFTLVVTHLVGMVTGSNFHDVLRSYKTGTFDPMKTGAGDILLFLLGPAVISLATAMYSRKDLMADNLLVVLISTIVSSAGGLFGTAAFVRAINLGGAQGKVLRLSVIARNVTTALAIAITNILGGDISICASVVVLTGIFGATIGARTLTAMGIKDPVSRGLGIGASSQGLGVASLVNEKDAFPFAAIAMVLTAVGATTLASIPFVKDLIMNIATGDLVTKVVPDAVTPGASDL